LHALILRTSFNQSLFEEGKTMDQIMHGMTKAGQQARDERMTKGPSPRVRGKTSNVKGAMREPSQTRARAPRGMEEVKEALHDFEEAKGDWSKGGG
jgi:hypothetical protein